MELGENTFIGANVFVGKNSRIGSDCKIFQNVVIYDTTIIGKRSIVHGSAVIGCDGFGFVPGDNEHFKIPQTGRVIIGDDVEIGANTVILKDVPEYATMVGNPAKNISTNTDTSFKPYGVRDIDANK